MLLVAFVKNRIFISYYAPSSTDDLVCVVYCQLANDSMTSILDSSTEKFARRRAPAPRRLRCRRSGDALFRRLKFIRVVMCTLFIAGRVVVHVLGWLDAMLLEESPQLV